ncbi:MAG: hypothetical protein JOZ19_14270 [Rubrobacter sp.]|nr:hypothetical protein [Rubrobacter sp.]
MQIIERLAAHYDVQELEEFARTYRWCPEFVVLECACGKKATHKRLDLLASVSTCECGADHTADIRGGLGTPLIDEDEVARHPWRHWHSCEDAGIPF